MTIRNSDSNPQLAEEARKKWVGVLVWRLDVFGNSRGCFRVKSVKVTEWGKGGIMFRCTEFRLAHIDGGQPAPACLIGERFVLDYEEGIKRGFKH